MSGQDQAGEGKFETLFHDHVIGNTWTLTFLGNVLTDGLGNVE